MLAARLWDKGDLRIEEVPDPGAPPPGWVRLKLDACGICGTDVEEYSQGPNLVPRAPHPLTGRKAPLTLGHEGVGTVEEAGAGVELSPGSRVAVESNLFCGSCWWCRRHQYQLCEKLGALGLMADGALAEYLLAPEFMCLPLGGHVPVHHAALAEPLSVATRAVRRARIHLGSTVGIVGSGTIGLLALQVARESGAQTVVVSERLPERRKLALRLGADLAVDPDEMLDAAGELTRGVGLDVTIEAAGNPAAAAAAVRWARKGGRTVLLGVFDGAVPVDMMDLLLGEKEIVASLSHVYDEDFATAVNLINEGRVEIEPLITDRINLADVLEDGFLRLVEEPASHVKIVVHPNGTDSDHESGCSDTDRSVPGEMRS